MFHSKKYNVFSTSYIITAAIHITGILGNVTWAW